MHPILYIRDIIDVSIAAEAGRFFEYNKHEPFAEVAINSSGGSVMAAYNIFDAMINFKGLLSVRNVGVAASAAGWLMLAGKRVTMVDYGLVMLHDPSYQADDLNAKERRGLEAFRNSIIKIFSRRTRKSVDEISAWMKEETWMDAEEALAAGFIDEIIETPARQEIENALKAVPHNPISLTKVVNQYLPETDVLNFHEMDKSILDVLNLSEGTKPSVVADHIRQMQTENAGLKAEVNNLKNSLSDTEKERDALQAAEKQREAHQAQTLIENAVKDGKIQNEAVEQWLGFAKNDYAGTEKVLNAMTAVKKQTRPLENFINQGGNGTDNPPAGTKAHKTFQDILNEAKKA